MWVWTETEKIVSNEIRGQNRFYWIKGLHIDSTKSFLFLCFLHKNFHIWLLREVKQIFRKTICYIKCKKILKNEVNYHVSSNF
jgi:hypothetical protein